MQGLELYRAEQVLIQTYLSITSKDKLLFKKRLRELDDKINTILGLPTSRDKRLKTQREFQERNREKRNEKAKLYARTPECKKHRQEYNKARTERGETKQYASSYRKKNKDKCLRNVLAYNQRHPDRVKATKEKSKDKTAEWHRDNYQKNKEQILARNKEWDCANRHQRNERIKERLKTDPQFKMVRLLRDRLRSALSDQGAKKEYSAKQLLGCDSVTLREYIESLFTEGMAWDNHGFHGWHIDHIVPCAAFDLTNIEDQKKCFHYTNLKPVWGIENIKKSDLLPCGTRGRSVRKINISLRSENSVLEANEEF